MQQSQDLYRRVTPVTPASSSGSQAAQRHGSATQGDPNRGYIPPPPPPLATPSHGMHIPPPPPRSLAMNGMNVPPPPPLGAYWTQPQHMQPAPPMNREPRAYDPTAYSAFISMPPLPPADQPLTSATYIPGGDSFGPDVGFPPLHSPTQQNPSRPPLSEPANSWYNDADDQANYAGYPSETMSHNMVSGNNPWSGSTALYQYSSSPEQQRQYQTNAAPPQYNAVTHPPSLQLSSSLQHSSSISHAPPTPSGKRSKMVVMPAKEKQEYTSPAPQHPSSAIDGNDQSLLYKEESVMHEPPPSPHDIAWPLETVIAWLQGNGFALLWQDTFRELNLNGTHFTDIGRSARANAVLHNDIYPHIGKKSAAKGIPFDKENAMSEGKRLRKLVRQIVENGGLSAGLSANGSTSSLPLRHQRQSSTGIASASTGGCLETSPQLGRQDIHPGSTPLTATSGEESPGMRMPPTTIATTASTKSGTSSVTLAERRLTNNKSGLDKLTNLVGKDLDTSTGRNASSSNAMALKQLDGAFRRASPAVNGDHNVQGSPAIHSTKPPVSLFYNNRNNAEEATVTARSVNDNNGPIRINATYPPPDGLSRHKAQGSNELKSPSFFNRILKRDHVQKDHRGDTLSASPTEQNLLSASTARTQDLFRSAKNTPVSERKFVFATPDGWNYRLIDVSGAESAEDMRAVICYNLGISDDPSISFYVTSPGQVDHDEALSDQSMLGARSRNADPFGSLKLFVRTGLSPATLVTAALNSGFPMSPFNTTATQNVPPAPESFQARLAPATSDKNESDGVVVEGVAIPRPRPSAGHLRNQNEHYRETVSLPESTRHAILEQKAAEHRRQADQKQQALHAERKQNILDPSIRRERGVIDFDRGRDSPYENRNSASFAGSKADQKPLRSAPRPPSEPSDTLRTISLRRPASSRSDNKSVGSWRSSGEQSQREAQKAATGPEGQDSPPQRQQARALARVGFGKTNGRTSPGSPRSPVTMSKGGLPFFVPDYEDIDGPKFRPDPADKKPALSLKLPLHVRPQVQDFNSPEVSPSTAHPEQYLRRKSTRKSYGPSFDLPQNEIRFTDRSKPAQKPPADEFDDDSDDDLFQVPLHKKRVEAKASTPADRKAAETSIEERPDSHRSPPLADTNAAVPRQLEVHSTPPHAGVEFVPSDQIRFNRRDSFASDLWANRPPAEALVEHLDDFFPNVDLDQPMLDQQAQLPNTAEETTMHTNSSNTADTSNPSWATLTSSSRTSLSEVSAADTLGSEESTLKSRDYIQNPAARGLQKQGGLGRTKSIRDVVKGAYSMSSGKRSHTSNISMSSERPPSIHFANPLPNRISALKPDPASGIVRRKSTKMFGAKIEQIKPSRGSRLIQLETIPQDTITASKPPTAAPAASHGDEPQRQATFKWMRGQLIGKGTFGRVYLGMNTTTGELLAVKQVEVNPKHPNADPAKIREMVKALDSEIDTMQHLDHVNIVQYLGCERKEYSISIFLEYISGGSIGSVLRKHGKFEESVVSSLTRQTLAGLAYLHHEGILHRDLKADNILLDLDGTCKISDFGISKKSRNPYNNDVSNSMQGSVFWMAPEVIRAQAQAPASSNSGGDKGGAPASSSSSSTAAVASADREGGYSAKVDIWSLGCVVLEMFAGNRPWSKEEAIGAIFKLGSLNQAPPIPDDVSSVVGPAALSFMYDCFTIDADDRPTAETLLRAPFCFSDPHYNFLDTELYAKIRGAF